MERRKKEIGYKERLKATNNDRIDIKICRSQWPRGLGRRSAAASLLRLWVRIPPGAWIFVCCECRVLSGRGLCDELITRPEKSYRRCCVVVCDLETSRMGTPYIYIYDISHLRVKHMIRHNVAHKIRYTQIETHN